MDKNERLALIEKLRTDADATAIDIEERRRWREYNEPYAPPRQQPHDLVYKTHEVEPQVQQVVVKMDAELKNYLEKFEEALIDSAVAFTNERLAEEVAKIAKSIARLRRDLAREKQINSGANVNRIKGKTNAA